MIHLLIGIHLRTYQWSNITGDQLLVTQEQAIGHQLDLATLEQDPFKVSTIVQSHWLPPFPGEVQNEHKIVVLGLFLFNVCHIWLAWTAQGMLGLPLYPVPFQYSLPPLWYSSTSWCNFSYRTVWKPLRFQLNISIAHASGFGDLLVSFQNKSSLKLGRPAAWTVKGPA
jgi:hypothetical protein